MAVAVAGMETVYSCAYNAFFVIESQDMFIYMVIL